MSLIQLLAIGFTLVLRFMLPDSALLLTKAVPNGILICVGGGNKLTVTCYTSSATPSDLMKDVSTLKLAEMFVQPE